MKLTVTAENGNAGSRPDDAHRLGPVVRRPVARSRAALRLPPVRGTPWPPSTGSSAPRLPGFHRDHRDHRRLVCAHLRSHRRRRGRRCLKSPCAVRSPSPASAGFFLPVPAHSDPPPARFVAGRWFRRNAPRSLRLLKSPAMNDPPAPARALDRPPGDPGAAPPDVAKAGAAPAASRPGIAGRWKPRDRVSSAGN